MNARYSVGAGTLGGLLCLVMSSCGLEWNGAGQFASSQPRSESGWNNLGVWRQVGENPPTYLPRGCSTKVLRVSSHGNWITDKRDRKRFFVPAGGSGGLSESVLCNDARKHCDPPPMLLFGPDRASCADFLDSFNGSPGGMGGLGSGGLGNISISPGAISCPGGIGGGCAPSM